jgi:hypothetical protein
MEAERNLIVVETAEEWGKALHEHLVERATRICSEKGPDALDSDGWLALEVKTHVRFKIPEGHDPIRDKGPGPCCICTYWEGDVRICVGRCCPGHGH